MKTFNVSNFEQHVALFERRFDLNARIPEFVFRRRNTHKLVVGDSGTFHKMEVFERLGATYKDIELNSMVIKPEAANVFHTTNKLLAYVLPFGSDFQKNWQVDLLGFGEDPARLNKGLPWMTASLLCYIGSSEAWCSYHDNHTFELDMFYVPHDCDTLSIFGKEPFSFEEVEEIISSYLPYIPKSIRLKLKENYFK